jgi:uroporphyrin-III C-methyltransferase
VVPGITAASGCTSYAGIPLTHRGISQGCTFITAHAETSLNVDWKSLAGLQHTIVFYMGLSKAPFISSQLQQAGMNSATPAAIIENGCCKQQRVITGSIAELQDMVLREDIQSPALIVVGEVVTLSDRLNWLEKFTAQQTLNEELVNTQKEKLSA